jgi:hypothetical protein
MTGSALVVGVDPGPVPGIVVLRTGLDRPVNPSIFQCDPDSAPWLVREMLSDNTLTYDQRVLAVERFVVGPRAARSSTAAAARLTRDMVGALVALGTALPAVRVTVRSAAQVMLWATDCRLDRVGLLTATTGMPHARAAARHALYATVADCGVPDPLSRKVRAP